MFFDHCFDLFPIPGESFLLHHDKPVCLVKNLKVEGLFFPRVVTVTDDITDLIPLFFFNIQPLQNLSGNRNPLLS